MKDEKYNGWTNRETWGVHLYVTSYDDIYREWVARARKTLAMNDDSTADWGETAAIFSLADQLRAWVDEAMADRVTDGPLSLLACDLLVWSLSRVNWDEVARALLDCVEVPA